MQKVTCISYHATGSGAVDDYLREFEGFNFAASGIECRFLQDPDGISDLAYNLIDNPNRLNSGYALKRYMRFAQNNHRTYENIFGRVWIEETRKYIDSLVTLKFKGYWHEELLLMSTPKRVYYKFRRGLSKVAPKRFKDPSWKNYFPNEVFYHVYVERQEFFTKTKQYINNLCSRVGDDSEFFMLDQFIPTSNIERYLQYVDDIKVIIVDRDPRDVLIQNIIVNDHVLPKDVDVFARVYKDHRRMASMSYKDSCVLRIQFEDLIYKYDETTKTIRNFLGIDEATHVKPFAFFKPEKSIKNTRMWVSHPEYANVADRMAQLLPEYLYDFD